MLDQEEFAELIRKLRVDYVQTPVPLPFWEEIAQPWFDETFPRKNELYGVEGLQRLGALHTVDNFVGCYYRWQRMAHKLEMGLTYSAMANAVQDAFGYSVLMRALSGPMHNGGATALNWTQVGKFTSPIERDLETLLKIYWDTPAMPVDSPACTMTARMAINMYRGTPGA